MYVSGVCGGNYDARSGEYERAGLLSASQHTTVNLRLHDLGPIMARFFSAARSLSPYRSGDYTRLRGIWSSLRSAGERGW